MSFSTRNKVNVSAGMSTMTDLVFLLLIFFIIISTLVSNGVNVDLPTSEGSTSAKSNLILSVFVDSTCTINGADHFKFSELTTKLSQIMKENEDEILYLQIDRNVPTGMTVEVIGLSNKRGWKIMLGSKPKHN